jgi:ribosomal-protein-alanine N-acetyltransferase
LSENFKIKPFKEDYLDQVAHINWSCLPEKYTKPFFLTIYYQFPKTFFVASVNSKIVGYIMCRIETGYSVMKKLSVAKMGHIISIAVLPEYRRMGIGKALISKIVESIPSEYNVNECYLEVRPSNKAAINLYKQFSFELVNVINRYYSDGEPAYVMGLHLRD